MKGFRNSVDFRNLLERPKKFRDYNRSFSRLLPHYQIGPFSQLAKKKAEQDYQAHASPHLQHQTSKPHGDGTDTQWL